MKRIIRTLSLIALVALVATSCKKKEEANFNMTVGETTGFEVGPSFDGSKAYFDPNDGYRFKWNLGDRVVIYNLDNDYTKSVAGIYTANQAGYTTSFSPEGAEVGAPKSIGYRVFYNAAKAETAIDVDNRVTFHVPATQTYEPECWADPNAMVMACTAHATGDHIGIFTMEHIFGYLNIGVGHSISDSRQVTSIVVQDDQWNLYGDLSLKLGPVNASTFTSLMNQCYNTNGGESYLTALSQYLDVLGYNADGQGKTITMDCSKSSNLITGQYKYFFVSLRPGALYKGFTVTINYNTGAPSTHHFDANRDYLIKPATFANVYALTDGRWWNGNSWE